MAFSSAPTSNLAKAAGRTIDHRTYRRSARLKGGCCTDNAEHTLAAAGLNGLWFSQFFIPTRRNDLLDRTINNRLSARSADDDDDIGSNINTTRLLLNNLGTPKTKECYAANR